MTELQLVESAIKIHTWLAKLQSYRIGIVSEFPRIGSSLVVGL